MMTNNIKDFDLGWPSVVIELDELKNISENKSTLENLDQTDRQLLKTFDKFDKTGELSKYALVMKSAIIETLYLDDEDLYELGTSREEIEDEILFQLEDSFKQQNPIIYEMLLTFVDGLGMNENEISDIEEKLNINFQNEYERLLVE